jgi:hypothetical protein
VRLWWKIVLLFSLAVPSPFSQEVRPENLVQLILSSFLKDTSEDIETYLNI